MEELQAFSLPVSGHLDASVHTTRISCLVCSSPQVSSVLDIADVVVLLVPDVTHIGICILQYIPDHPL